MRFLLNSAVVTSPGTYSYRKVSPEEAKNWFTSGDPPLSTIGYVETAEALSELLGEKIEVNRQTISMSVGDEALVFRLVLPPGSPRLDPKNKGRLRRVLLDGYWELGMLVKLSSNP